MLPCPIYRPPEPLWAGRGRRSPARAALLPEPDLCGHEPAAAAGGCPVGAEACRPAAGGRRAGAGHQPGGPSGSARHGSRLLGITWPTGTSSPPLSIWPGTPHLTPGPWVPEAGFWLSVLRPRYALAPRDARGHGLPSRLWGPTEHRPLPEDGIRVVHRPLDLRSPDWTSFKTQGPGPSIHLPLPSSGDPASLNNQTEQVGPTPLVLPSPCELGGPQRFQKSVGVFSVLPSPWWLWLYEEQ